MDFSKDRIWRNVKSKIQEADSDSNYFNRIYIYNNNYLEQNNRNSFMSFWRFETLLASFVDTILLSLANPYQSIYLFYRREISVYLN